MPVRGPVRRLALAGVLLSGAPALAQPVDVCAVLGLAGKFTVATPGRFQARPAFSREPVERYGGATIGSICARKGSVQSTWLDGDFVSPLARGAAFSFRRTPPFADANIVNFVITGGAGVSGVPYGQFDAIDTYGANPWVAWCQEAVDSLDGISAGLAALAPTLTLGNVVVGAGESFTIDVRGQGGAVVELASLVLAPTSAPERGHYCDGLDDSQIAVLEILADPGDHVVVNVAGEMRRGACHVREFGGERLLFNVPTAGRRIVVGDTSRSFIFPFLLAPHRDVILNGDTNDDVFWGNVLARGVRIRGRTWIYADCYTLPAFSNGLVEAGFNEQCDLPDDSACPGQCWDTGPGHCGLPAGDACAEAVEVTSFPFTHEQNVDGAVTTPDEPALCATASNTVWYRLTAPADGTVTAATIDNRHDDTVLAAYAGTCGSLTSLGCNDDVPPGLQSEATFPVTAGETYHLQLGRKTTRLGWKRLRVAFAP